MGDLILCCKLVLSLNTNLLCLLLALLVAHTQIIPPCSSKGTKRSPSLLSRISRNEAGRSIGQEYCLGNARVYAVGGSATLRRESVSGGDGWGWRAAIGSGRSERGVLWLEGRGHWQGESMMIIMTMMQSSFSFIPVLQQNYN